MVTVESGVVKVKGEAVRVWGEGGKKRGQPKRYVCIVCPSVLFLCHILCVLN